MEVRGSCRKGLVDTGCTTTLVHSRIVKDYVGNVNYVTAFDGSAVRCTGNFNLVMVVSGVPIEINAIVVDNMMEGVDIILGLDAITRLGGVTVSGRQVTFGAFRPRLLLWVTLRLK